MKIVLGSSSLRRLEIIRRIVPGYEVEVIAPDIDERSSKYNRPRGLTNFAALSALTMQLARDKNEAVCRRLTEDAVVVTADTVTRCNGELREKPVNSVELRRFLESYQREPVDVVGTAWVSNIKTGWYGSATDMAIVRFKPFHDRVDAIVADSAFYNSAGGFLIEHSLMSDRIEKITGNRDTVQGLSSGLVGLLIQDALRSEEKPKRCGE